MILLLMLRCYATLHMRRRCFTLNIAAAPCHAYAFTLPPLTLRAMPACHADARAASIDGGGLMMISALDALSYTL